MVKRFISDGEISTQEGGIQFIGMPLQGHLLTIGRDAGNQAVLENGLVWFQHACLRQVASQ